MAKGHSCEAVNQLLDDYLDGALDSETNKNFENHMDLCPACRVHLDQYRETIQLVQESESPEVPKELVTHTMAFLKKEFTCKTQSSSDDSTETA